MLYIMPITELTVDVIPCQDVSLDPIKSTHLELDDVPPELLPKHHECILKRVRVSRGAPQVPGSSRMQLI